MPADGPGAHEVRREEPSDTLHKVGTLAVGDPRRTRLTAGRRHNQRTRAWRIGHLLQALHDKAETAGIIVRLVDERGTSSTCPACASAFPGLPGGSCPAGHVA